MQKVMCFFLLVIIIKISITCHANQIVTNPERNDGFGAQFQTIIYSVIWAELNDTQFVYTPFKQMEHNYDQDVDYLEKKEWLINFKGNFGANNSDAVPLNVFSVIGFFKHNLNACWTSEALEKIKRIFRENKNFDDYFDCDRFNIVVHLRRHNSHDNRVEGTNTPEDVYLTTINKLREIYRDKHPQFHLHSQGANEDFKNFNAPDIILHLNETAEDAFTPMVLADVLVTSASSFSYTAGILSEGIVYYMPFWHPPLPNWISISELNSQ